MSGQNTFVSNRPVRNAGDVPFTPAGGVAATTVQGAIEEVDSEKLAKASNLSDVAVAATARTNLGLGTISTQNANAVNITGGTIDLGSRV